MPPVVGFVRRRVNVVPRARVTGCRRARMRGVEAARERTGGQLLVDCLLAQGVDTAFGVPGESYLAVLDAFHDVADRLRFVVCRQEGGAAYMAEAHGKLTGRPGVCFVTRGPGATNAAIGVHTAQQDSTPMLLFVGQVGLEHRGLEAFQEVEYRSFFDDLAKWVVEVQSPDELPSVVDRAVREACSDRPGPVVVSLPEDMLRATTTAGPGPCVEVAEREPTGDEVAAVSEVLSRAERPVLLVGGGGWTPEGRRHLRDSATRNDLPVVVTFRRHGLFDNTDDRYAGEAGVGMPLAVRETLASADVVIALGSRFGEMATGTYTLFGAGPSTRPDGQAVVHVHADADEFGKVVEADATVHAGPNEAARALADLDLPGSLVEAEIDNRINEMAMRMGTQGIDFATYMEAMGRDLESMRDEMRDGAEIATRVDLGLRAVADAEGLAGDSEQLEEYLGMLAEQTGGDVDGIREALTSSGRMLEVRADLRKQAALDWVMERVEIVDEDGKEVDRAMLEPPEEPEPAVIPEVVDAVEETMGSADDEDAADGGDEEE